MSVDNGPGEIILEVLGEDSGRGLRKKRGQLFQSFKELDGNTETSLAWRREIRANP